jgi:ATP-binding cassette subfamily B multidrug efflux pump
LRVFFDLMWFFKQEKKSYLAGISLLVMVALFNLVPPLIVGRIVDQVKHHTLSSKALVRWLVIILVVALIVYVLRYLWRILLFGNAIKLSTLLRSRLYKHFSLMSPQFYHNHRIGDLMAHSTNDIRAIEATATDGILTLVDSITTGSVVIATMAIMINWKLTLVALIPMPIMAIATSHYGTLLHRRFAKAQAAFSDINDKVQENISGMRVIKAFGQEDYEERTFTELSTDVVDKNVAVAKIDALFDPTITLIVGLSFFLTVAVGAVFVVNGPLTIGGLTTFTMYLGQLIWPMLAFGWLFNIVERGRASNDRVNALFAIAPDIVDSESARDAPPTGAIQWSIPSFKYPNTETPVLEHIDVSINKGATLGIVGKTGSGKTTLLRLLLREFDLQEGAISIGGQRIHETKLAALRGTIAYVPQDHFLFSTTISGNIAFGKPTASIAEIERVAQIASIHEDIMRFEDGYQTVVGERGVTLSGGQKQRISIARALLLDADILILDDSLSAVDAKTEVDILDALQSMPTQRTTLIATHRLSAVEKADRIIVLEHGTIVEEGTHSQLLTANGWYATMYQRQQLESFVAEGGGR